MTNSNSTSYETEEKLAAFRYFYNRQVQVILANHQCSIEILEQYIQDLQEVIFTSQAELAAVKKMRKDLVQSQNLSDRDEQLQKDLSYQIPDHIKVHLGLEVRPTRKSSTKSSTKSLSLKVQDKSELISRLKEKFAGLGLSPEQIAGLLAKK